MTKIPTKARKRNPAEPDRIGLCMLPDATRIGVVNYTTAQGRELTDAEYRHVACMFLKAFLTEERGPLPDLPDLGKATPLPDLSKVPA